VVEQLLAGPYAAVLSSLMDAAERNPDLAALLAAAQTKLVEAVRTISARARVRGELRWLPEPSDVAALIVGPLLYRRLFSHEPLSEGFFRLVIDNVVRTAGGTRDTAHHRAEGVDPRRFASVGHTGHRGCRYRRRRALA
jgi:hypothetical protein